jgi:hypothetical protein
VPVPPAGGPPYPPAQGISPEYSHAAHYQHPRDSGYDGAWSARLGYDPPEHTDSLTGQILARGRPDTDGSGNTMRVVMIMLIALAAVVVGTVIAIS